MTNRCSAASLQDEVWIQDVPYLKQRSAYAFHTLLCVIRGCQTVHSAVHCYFIAIANMRKYQKQLRHVCLVMNLEQEPFALSPLPALLKQFSRFYSDWDKDPGWWSSLHWLHGPHFHQQVISKWLKVACVTVKKSFSSDMMSGLTICSRTLGTVIQTNKIVKNL